MDKNKFFYVPDPIVDQKERTSLDVLTERYEKLTKRGKFVEVGTKIRKLVPQKVKIIGNSIKSDIVNQKLYNQTMEVIASGFNTVEEQVVKFSISEKTILKKTNSVMTNYEITKLEQICFARSYELSKLVNAYKNQDLIAAFVEGGVTGVAGFAGLPFNIVLSTFLYFRAVQSVAMFYGYDVKN